MRARQAEATDMGAEREHHVWNNLVYLLLTQDYLLDNHIKKTGREKKRGGRCREKACEVKREGERGREA